MATLAAYPDWYNDKILLRQDITEVAIVRSYTPTDEDLGSWDASAEKNGSVMAYVSGTKLTLVCDELTELPDLAFNRFVSLKRATGFGAITRFGNWAFYCTPSLEYIDIDPSKIEHIGHDAFRLSSAEDSVDFSNVPSTAEIGVRAIRSKRWKTSALDAIRQVDFPKYVYLDVPNADSQLNYDDPVKFPYATKNGVTISVAKGGCPTLVAYHSWQCMYAGSSKSTAYPDFITWFNAKLNADGKYAEKTDKDSSYPERDYLTLGWEQTSEEHLESEAQLASIVERLACGFPTEITIRANTDVGYHSVLVIGCDPATHKLAIVDSGVRIERGVFYWIAYEDLCTEGTEDKSESVQYVDFKEPVLAAGNTWFSRGNHGIAKSTITEIEIVREIPSDFKYDTAWDASEDGKVKAYVNGTKLTIAGNGYRSIWGNPDSSYAFSDRSTDNKNWFKSVTIIDGAELLNMRNVQTIMGILSGCRMLTFIDVSDWDTTNCEEMNSAFQILSSMKSLDLSKWNVRKVKTMRMMFQGHGGSYGPSGLVSVGDLSGWATESLEDVSYMCSYCENLAELDITGFDVSKVTMENGMQRTFYHCGALRELDFSNWNNKDAASSSDMLSYTPLEKITIGKNFRFNGFSLPASDESKIPLADGNWYDIDGTAYTSDRVAAANVARTYYASKFVIEGEDKTRVFVTAGLLKQMAMAARSKSGKEDLLKPADALRLLALETDT